MIRRGGDGRLQFHRETPVGRAARVFFIYERRAGLGLAGKVVERRAGDDDIAGVESEGEGALLALAAQLEQRVWDVLGPRLTDVQDLRLADMDRHGIEMMILSLNAPAIQAIHDTARAIDAAVRRYESLLPPNAWPNCG